MRLKHVYLLLFVIGTLLPATHAVLFMMENGFDIPLLFRQLFSTRAGTFFGLDVMISTVVLWVLCFTDGRMAGVKYLWAPVVASLLVGVSSGLPLYLFLREGQLEETLRAH